MERQSNFKFWDSEWNAETTILTNASEVLYQNSFALYFQTNATPLSKTSLLPERSGQPVECQSDNWTQIPGPQFFKSVFKSIEANQIYAHTCVKLYVHSREQSLLPQNQEVLHVLHFSILFFPTCTFSNLFFFASLSTIRLFNFFCIKYTQLTGPRQQRVLSAEYNGVCWHCSTYKSKDISPNMPVYKCPSIGQRI